MRPAILILLTCLCLAAEPPETSIDAAAREAQPRPVTLADGRHQVADVLREIEKQTGNRVIDRRSEGAVREVRLGFEGTPFWAALDQLAAKLDARTSPYAEEGAATLLDGPRRVGPVVYSKACRFELKRIGARLDLESHERSCVLLVDAAWEPRLAPFYLTLDTVTIGYDLETSGKGTTITERSRTAQPVAGRGAQELEVRLRAPAKGFATISRFDGEMKLLGAIRMLNFTFPLGVAEALPVPQTREGVQVAVTRLVPGTQTWSLDVVVRNPAGTPAFETHQSWLDNNRIHLERVVSGKRVVWQPQPDDWQLQSDLTPRFAHIRYIFGDAPGKGAPREWTLVYRTPGPMVELTVPFSFRDVPRP